MENVILTIKYNKQISNDVYLLRLEGDLSAIKSKRQLSELSFTFVLVASLTPLTPLFI